MTPCGNPNTSTTWCCGANTDCCNSSNAEYIAATLQGYIATLTTTSSTTENTAITTSAGTLTSASASSTSTPLNQASSESSSGLSTAAKAGIGIGVGAGAIVVLAGLAWILYKKRRPKAAVEEELRPFYVPDTPPKELASTEVAREMPSHSTSLVQELHGESVRK